MARIGLLGRIMLILMAAMLAVIVAALAVEHVERGSSPPPFLPYPRIEQAAGAIDLLRDTDAALRPTILRALNGTRLRATIKNVAPSETDALRRAPRVEALVRTFAGAGIGDDLRAYTDATLPSAPPDADKEGLPERVVWRMPDGRFLVLNEVEPPRQVSLTLFGRPPGFWIGVLGLGVAGLALLSMQREMKPLRLLTATATAFDGRTPAKALEATGAPDIRRLIGAVHGMQERVATLLQERSFLIGAISHDLKTYLTRLRLRAESITDADQQGRVIADLDAMTDLIETSLAFARGTTVSQSRGLVDLADLVAIEAAERAAFGQPVEITGDDVSDAIVGGDPVALRRVIANLVDNAVKFGRGRIEIALDAEPAACRVFVSDDGPGVTEAERAAIFSPFYRIEGSRSGRTGGSGLGLAIARQIVEAHGGSISVSGSRLGGACFTISLPLAANRRGFGAPVTTA